MQNIMDALERLNNISDLPLSLIDSSGQLLATWPKTGSVTPLAEASAIAIEDFRAHGRDPHHPFITFLDPGFLLGIVQLRDNLFVFIGLVSPYRHSRADVLKMVNSAIPPAQLQQFVDRLISQPLVSLEKMKDMICVLTHLVGEEVPAESILFVDNATQKKLSASMAEHSLYDQREEAELHVPMSFEDAVCSAIEAGNRALLEHTLFSPVQGRVGRMSANDLRQSRYQFICMAVLASRAAIRGGLPEETSFGLSDLYCQRADMLTEIPLIQNLTFTMLMDYCGRVREIRKKPNTSPLVGRCLDYISAHLHEPIGLEVLSRHCGLCTRSLSLRFKEEMGMGIPEYIHREKLAEADYLLRHTDYALSDIASFLSYPTQSYFTQIFKRYRGTTPQKFRDSREG